MLEKVGKDVNAKTGSTFYVVGLHEMLSLSFRVWKDAGHPKNVTVFGFRFRITQLAGTPSIMNFEGYVQNLLPSVIWSGTSPTHVSIAGATKIPVGPNNAPLIVEKAKEANLAEKFWDLMLNTFPCFTPALTKEEFEQLVIEIMEQEVGAHIKPESTAVIFEFGKTVKELDAGVEKDVSVGDVLTPADGDNSPTAGDHLIDHPIQSL